MKYLFGFGPMHADLGLLLLRIGLGAVFVVHGWMKLMNMDVTVGFFASIGLSILIVYIVMLVELLGGIALILGAFTSLVGILLAIDMIAAIVLVKFPGGFIGGYEFEFTLLMASLAIAFLGAGRYSLDKMWHTKK